MADAFDELEKSGKIKKIERKKQNILPFVLTVVIPVGTFLVLLLLGDGGIVQFFKPEIESKPEAGDLNHDP